MNPELLTSQEFEAFAVKNQNKINEIIKKTEYDPRVKNKTQSQQYYQQPQIQQINDPQYLAYLNSMNESEYEEKPLPEINLEEIYSRSKLPKEIINELRGTIEKEVIEETKKTQPIQQKPNINSNFVPSNIGGIDYNYIKFIVNESVTNCLTKMLENNNIQNLNENKSNNLSTIRLNDNDTLRLVTEDGTVYEAPLIYKGKLKKK